MLANLSNRQMVYVNAIIEHAPTLGIDINKDTFSRAELRQVSMTMKGKKWIPNWITHDLSRRAGRGLFTIPEIQEAMAVTPGSEVEGDGLADSAPDANPHFVEDNPQTDTTEQAVEELITA
tara:strand:+ start:1967 stop:2329 length:363 start_codon:yes stop_codon:yes gene_type:complete